MDRHLVLVGLPGSGKSTVGRLVSDTLAVEFYDVDVRIVRSTGLSIPRIFERHGEVWFRTVEAETVRTILQESAPGVIAPGGGWAAHGDNLDTALPRAVCVYLRTSPAVAARRVGDSGGRPVVPAGQELRGVQELLRNRERYYARSPAVVDTDDRTAEEVAAEVVKLARAQGPV